MKFDRKKFFDGTRQWLGPLTSQQVNGLTFILDSMERDPFLTRVEWAAYMLATVKHETAHTFQPIHEYGSHNYFVQRYGSQTRIGKRLGNDTPEEGATYAGRGDVQLTGETNYEKAEDALRREYPEIVADFERRTGKLFDLTVGDQPNDQNDPNNAMDPAVAYAIMSFGMRTGLFTGLKLSDYTKPAGFDSLNARRIINGMDQAPLIANYYGRFLSILNAAKLGTNTFADLEDGNFLDIPQVSADSSPDVPATPPAVNDAPPTGTTVSSSPDLPTESPGTTQVADTIVNSGDVAPATPAPVDQVIAPPVSTGTTAQATKVTIGGLVVPPTIVAIWNIVDSLMNRGFLTAQQISDTVIKFMTNNTKYFLLLLGVFLGFLMLKRIERLIIYVVSMITHAMPTWNSVIVQPTETPKKKWWQMF